MKRSSAIVIFMLLVGSALLAGVDSLLSTERRAQYEVDRALALTLQLCEPDRLDADTIQVYRSHIMMAEVRDTAYITMGMDGCERHSPTMKAKTGLTFGRLWTLSDQRASGALTALAALWLMLSLWWFHRHPAQVMADLRLGGLQYDSQNQRFYVDGREIHFTPMQQALMELFMAAPDHLLMQQDICDSLWPKKPDASATLYTLIRRLKPILEKAAGLHITCDRGRAYHLIDKPTS